MEPSDDEDEDPLVARLSVEALQPSDDEDDAPGAVAVGTKGTFLFENEFGNWYSVPGYPEDKLRGSDQGYIQNSRGARAGGWGNPTLGCQNWSGYRRVMVNGKQKQVHNLLCRIWHGFQNDPLLTPQHGPGGKGDNSRSNLIGWATRREQRTEHQREHTQQRNGKPILVWPKGDPKSSARLFESSWQAQKATGAGHLDSVANGKQRQSKGFVAEWADARESQDDLEGEIWKEANPRLWVSTCGRAQMRTANGNGWGNRFTPTPCKDCKYAAIASCGKQTLFHILLYDAFFDDRQGREIDHCNRNSSDNHLNNLRPATRQEQIANRTLKSRTLTNNSKKKPVVGRKVGATQWIQFGSVREAADHIGVSGGNLNPKVRAGKPYHGWEFKYVTSPQAAVTRQQGLVESDLEAPEEED